ncbi:hypothetical protein V6L77_15365 [Pannonibacter sp. Pt2-lr]
MVEIAKALHRKARILILDEPTASLTERETERLFAFIRSAVTEGVGVVYISHRIQEFQAIASRITVLRDGRLIGTVDAKGISEKALVEMMTGRPVDEIYPAITRAAVPKPVLSIRGLHAWGLRAWILISAQAKCWASPGWSARANPAASGPCWASTASRRARCG